MCMRSIGICMRSIGMCSTQEGIPARARPSDMYRDQGSSLVDVVNETEDQQAVDAALVELKLEIEEKMKAPKQ